MLILFFSLGIKAEADIISITPSSSINPSSTIEGNLFSNLSAIFPTLILINPKNKTYVNNNAIPLTYTATGEDAVWYSLDSGTNITLSHPITFNASEGSHILFLYANNSAGKTSKNITFFIDSVKFEINETKWKGDKKGNSTNLTDYSYEELQNLSNLTLEHTNFGKIKFNQNINLTDDSNFSDNEIDIESYINISSNRIEINSIALPNFNKPATLELYGLTFTNPRILKDGSVCPSIICIREDYSVGILRFNVTGFSVYSSEETPAETPSTPPSGGGTAGGTSSGASSGKAITKTTIKSFSTNTEQITVSLTQGSVITKKINVTNSLDKKIIITLEEKNLGDFLIIKDKKLELNPYESKEISLDIITRENILPNLYIGKLIMKEESTEKEISFLIEVESKGALFDLTVKIPDEFLNVFPGKKILAEISLFNLGEIKRADVLIEYIIKDKEGNEISSQKETIAVETKASSVKEITIPENIKEGKYILYTRVEYDNKIASSSVEFNIISINWEKIYILGIIFSIIISSSVIYYFYREKKRQREPLKRRLTISDIIKRK